MPRIVRLPLVRDAALGLALAAFALLVLWFDPHDRPARAAGWPDLAAFAVTVAAVTARRRWPRTAIAATTAASVALTVAGHEQPILTVVLLFLFHTYAQRGGRRAVRLATAAVAALLYAAALGWADGSWWAPENLGVIAWLGLGTALGDARRSRRAYLAEAERRAERAERTRDEEARRRVAEERLRIARDLHDIVAHHIAVIKVQATGARHVLHQHPEHAGPALEHISRSSDAALRELAAVIGLLRDPDRDEPAGPAPGLAGLPELLDAFAGTGLRVEHHAAGAARDLPAVVDVTAYRILQEALTNAHKHGSGTAKLHITYAEESVTVQITNPIAAAGPDAPGYGLLGMRERATAVGGRLSAGPDGGRRFTVTATLPAAPADPR
ncbi:sensor histidine kinase [Dactylosporangium sp. NPDC051541]|uniref:sensor histidine kinase n=1 Tax=Dactylosporangium sp. NPDC051541 TaxID=3363977 RepID=UPI0037B27CA2